MKNLIIISMLFFSITAFSQGYKNDSLINQISQLKTDIQSLNKKLDDLSKEYESKNHIIKIDDLDNVISSFMTQKKESFWEKTLPYLIPIIVLVLGAFITLSQLKIQSKLTLVHTRANKISEARINWNNDLRVVLSKLIKASTELHYHLRIALDKIAERNKYEKDSVDWTNHHNEADKYYQSQLNLMVEFIALTNEVQLYLDIKESNGGNTTHKELEETLSEYVDSIMEYPNIKDVKKFNTVANELIRKSRKVLNDSWDKARIEGEKKLDEAYKESFLINRLIKIFKTGK